VHPISEVEQVQALKVGSMGGGLYGVAEGRFGRSRMGVCSDIVLALLSFYEQETAEGLR
jgi:hypothetical protein